MDSGANKLPMFSCSIGIHWSNIINVISAMTETLFIYFCDDSCHLYLIHLYEHGHEYILYVI